MQHLDPDSDKFATQGTRIQSIIDDIESGEGNYEAEYRDASNNDDSTKVKGMPTAYHPLANFCYYVERNEYPHPILLKYLAKVFSKILDGATPDSAFGLGRKRGRPPVEESVEERNKRANLCLEIINRQSSKDIDETLMDELTRVGKKNGYSKEVMYREYKKTISDCELGMEIGRKIQEDRNKS